MCNQTTVRRGVRAIYLAAIGAAPLALAGVVYAQPFFMGSDISLETFMQQQGKVFSDNGVAMPADQILYDNGDNMFRLRLFVSPQTTYTNSNTGAIQTLSYDVALAQQIKADDPSAKFELDLHYSNTWADPGHQTTPTAWQGESLSALQTTVYNYTLSTLQSFNTAGVMPDMVEVGNETNSGMLWPTGELNFSGTTAQQEASWGAYGSLVNSAISAVRAAQGAGPKIQVSLTIGNGDSSGEPQFFYGDLTNPLYGNVPASSFDVMGADFYPTTNDLSTLSSNLTALANTFNKKIMVMETDAPWETTNAPKSDPNYPDTQAGQAAYLTALATTVKNLPNNDGMGLLYWYPEAVLVSGYNIYNGGSTALFDNSGAATQAVTSFNITQNQWNTAASGNWNTSGNWTNAIPNGSDIEADFLSAISANRTISTSSAITLGTIRFQNANTYTIGGTGSLNFQATVGWAYAVVQQGTQQINVPVTIASDTIFSVAAGTTLAIGGPLTVNSGQILNPSGAGMINYSSSITLNSSASMTIDNSTQVTSLAVGNGATLAVIGSGTLLQTNSLSDNGTIDLQSNGLLINYGSGPDPVASVRTLLTSGFNGGAWNGPGIISSSAATNSGYGLGYADAADAGNPANLASGTIEIKYTLLGDANLDGVVNGIDFGILAANFNKGVSAWDEGDFNYDSIVNGIDFGDLAANFNKGASGGSIGTPAYDDAAILAFAQANGLLADVPEPGVLGGGVVAGAALLRRRRR